MTEPHRIRRRAFLQRSVAGALALGGGGRALLLRASAAEHTGMLAPRPGHVPARAQQLLIVFLTGGFSHLDTFDPKPELRRRHGQPQPAFGLRADEVRAMPLLGSPFNFRACGQSGLAFSELFPGLSFLADDLCVIRSMHTDIVEHFQATLAMHTGSSTVPLPSIGSWISYGLGTLNRNLPPYVVLAEHLPYAGAQVWDSQFLPPDHQGVRVIPGDAPIPNLSRPARAATLADLEAEMLKDVNETHAHARPADLELRARIQTYETARGMMLEAPEIFSVKQESAPTLEAYGLGGNDQQSFAWQCLIARRLLERGVRVVELIDTGSHDNWDAHGDMQSHRPKARRVDRALAALLQDLKARGLLQHTAVAICTEFGRTPWSNDGRGPGRNHYAKAFTSLLAGAGVRGGLAYGSTDELGARIVENPVHVHDYHATLLHLLGLDHERLTYRYAGRDFRLTDVAGKVLTGVLA